MLQFLLEPMALGHVAHKRTGMHEAAALLIQSAVA
jgi:hypothetical protein